MRNRTIKTTVHGLNINVFVNGLAKQVCPLEYVHNYIHLYYSIVFYESNFWRIQY